MSRTWTTIPLMMCGIWSAAPAGMLTCRRFRVDFQREVHDDGAEVERADVRGGDRRDRERRAVERARHVDLAGRLRQHLADARADERVPDFATGRARRVGFLFGARLGRAASWMSASEHFSTPDRSAVKPIGNCEENPVISCSPSLRVIRRSSGL